MDDLLVETQLYNYSHPSVSHFTTKALVSGSNAPENQARDLYYAVRDGISYEVFGTDISQPGLRASSIVASRRGFCLHKSILYVTVCRRQGIPARLLAATVQNHLSTPELEALVGGQTFLHWYTEIQINGKWVKVTPVFGQLLCRLYGITPLEFDVDADSIHQNSNHGGEMSFLMQTRLPDSPSYESLAALVKTHHPLMVNETGLVPTAAAVSGSAET
ncbi:MULTISPECIES: transglutaminase family protein [unclassified Arthrobacter]|uniref:transglutaminase-like domain-containing protein n=1 Tax=unclassified Arthrobacter TaxID=235627 RepID=UPI0015E28A49|nr:MULTISPECIES: transglutaminase-like domain-containing protein [unclassified Arthrobacter]